MKKPNAKSQIPAVALPEPVLVKNLKRKQFSSTGDVHVQGNVNIATQLVVGGDLLVDGDLLAEEVFCLGKLTVTGDVRVQSLYVGHALDVGGHIDVEFLLKTGCRADWMARLLELDQRKGAGEQFVDLLVHPAILARQTQHEEFGAYGDIQGLGYLSCGDLDCQGSLELDDALEASEVQFVGGHLAALSIHIAGDCNCQGEVFSELDIEVEGSLHAGSIVCEGNLRAGAIDSQEDISVWGHIRAKSDISSLLGEIHAGRWIATAAVIHAAKYIKAGEAVVGEKGISCGKDYGILAATTLPRSAWSEQGMVSANIKPRFILSGEFVEGKKMRHIDALGKKRKVEID
jgi:predicted acyltransferase (DUF342 family)